MRSVEAGSWPPLEEDDIGASVCDGSRFAPKGGVVAMPSATTLWGGSATGGDSTLACSATELPAFLEWHVDTPSDLALEESSMATFVAF